MDDSLSVVNRHRSAGTLLNHEGKIAEPVLADLGAAGYWGLLVGEEYGGSGAPFNSFAPFLTRMALIEPTVAGLASVHGCIGAVDPVRTFGNAEQKQRFLPGLAAGGGGQSSIVRGVLAGGQRSGTPFGSNEHSRR